MGTSPLFPSARLGRHEATRAQLRLFLAVITKLLFQGALSPDAWRMSPRNTLSSDLCVMKQCEIWVSSEKQMREPVSAAAAAKNRAGAEIHLVS